MRRIKNVSYKKLPEPERETRGGPLVAFGDHALTLALVAIIAVVAVIGLMLTSSDSPTFSVGAKSQGQSKTEVASSDASAAVEQGTKLQKNAEAKFRKSLNTAAAKAERAKSKTAYRGLDADEAKTAVAKAQPSTKEQSWTPPPLLKGEKIKKYASETLARVDMPGRKADAFVESAGSPMAVKSGKSFEAVDLTLTKRDGSFVPEKSAVKTEFPAALTSPILSPDVKGSGVVEFRPGKTSAAAQPLGDKKVFYSGTALDTDVIAEAMPSGNEISWALRSPDAPETLPLEITGESGFSLRSAVDGSVDMLVDGKQIGTVERPRAFDAQGATVPVSYEVTANGIGVKVPHRSQDFAYPIIVDPATNFWGVLAYQETSANVNYGIMRESFTFYPQTGAFTNPSGSLTINAAKGWGPGGSASLDYNPPAASTVFRSTYKDTFHSFGSQSALLAGQYSASAGWGETKWGAWINGGSCVEVSPGNVPGCQANSVLGNSTGMATTPWIVTCAAIGCQMGGVANNWAGFSLGLSAKTTAIRSAGFSQSYQFFSDYDNPVISGLPTLTTWTSRFTDRIPVITDGGVGVSGNTSGWHAGQAFRMEINGALERVEGPACGGGYTSPCLTNWTGSAFAVREGVHDYKFTSSDIVGHTTVNSVTTRTDNAGPEVDIGGRFGAFALDNATLGTNQPRVVSKNAPFVIQAFDGRRLNPDGSAAPKGENRSGVKSIKANIYGSDTWGGIDLNNLIVNPGIPGPQNSDPQACDENTYPASAQNSCKLSYAGTFNAEALPPGIYYFRVEATDYANNTTTKDFKVGVGVANFDSVVEGQSTSRYAPVKIKRDRGTATTATLQYRLAPGSVWCAIPNAAVTLESDVTAVAASPFALDANGNSAQMVVDLQKLTTIAGNTTCGGTTAISDGNVFLRALMTGTGSEPPRASEDVAVRYENGGAGTENTTKEIGPGTVDLVSGNFSMTATDVDVSAFKSDLTVTRTYNSRYNQKVGPYGPGWTLGLPTDDGQIAFKRVVDYADVNLPEEERFPAVEIETNDGEFFMFELSSTPNVYTPQAGLEDLRLERIPDAYDANRTAGFKIYDRENGTVSSFNTKLASTQAGQYEMTDTYSTSSSDKTSFAYGVSSTIGTYPTYEFAPAAGIQCRASTDTAAQSYTNLPRGCQALEFNYSFYVNGTLRRLTSIDLKTYDPQAGAMTESTVAQYNYDSLGRLVEAWDPRITPAMKSTYTILADTDNRIVNIGPPGEEPFSLGYLIRAGDTGYGRLRTVTRSALGGTTAVTNVRYDVPMSGSNAPANMSVAETSKWGQERGPFQGSAIFAPDAPPSGDPATNFGVSSVSYMDPLGREVNTRVPGDRMNVTEYDKWGATTRTLTAENRARAMAKPTAAEKLASAEKWDTQSTYADVPGSSQSRRHLIETLGPEHSVRLANGSTVDARSRTQYTYDQGSPIAGVSSKEPFDLVTETRVSARVGTVDHDMRTSRMTYGTTEAQWEILAPREVIEDASSGGLQINKRFDYDADGLETARYQPRSGSSSEPSTTRTIYYTSGANGNDSACGNKPEWMGLACKSLPGAQPTTSGLPGLPSKQITYNSLRLPLTVTESATDSGGTSRTRTTTNGYDAAGRLITEDVVGSAGTGAAVKKTKHVFSTTTGRELETQFLNADNSVDKRIIRVFDALGRQTNYTDAEGHASSATYDILNRVKQTNDGKATRDYTYDALNGNLTGLSDSGVATAGTFGATYDASGRMVAESLPGGLTKAITYDTAGEIVRQTYTRTAGCTSGCVFMDETNASNIHGETATRSGLPTQVGSPTSQEFAYDGAGRLTEARDTSAGQCTIRQYVMDVDSNRTQSKSIAPGSGGACNPGGTPSVTTNSYDNADRITNSGYAYDAFGRTTSAPQAAGGGTSAVNATYFVTDEMESLTESGVTQTVALDPVKRMARRTKAGTVTSYSYLDDLDEPAWIQTGSGWSRWVEGIDGNIDATHNSTGGMNWTISSIRGDTVADAGGGGLYNIREIDEFGVVKNGLPASRPYGFHGSKSREAITDTGIVAMGARTYLPRTGRFMQTDPVAGGTANPYEYPSDPMNDSDLNGKFTMYHGPLGVGDTRAAISIFAYLASSKIEKLSTGQCVKKAVTKGARHPAMAIIAMLGCKLLKLYGTYTAARELSEIHKAFSKTPTRGVILKAGIGTKGPWLHWYPRYSG